MDTDKNQLDKVKPGRLNPTEHSEWVEIRVNGKPVLARQGEILAASLLSAGYRSLRHTVVNGEARGVFCGMGVCRDCIVTVNGKPFVRACLTRVEPNLIVEMDEI